jgi:transposase-like protein
MAEQQKRRSSRYPAEMRERAVRMVFEHADEYASPWKAIESIAAKLGINYETLRIWVRRAEDRRLPSTWADYRRTKRTPLLVRPNQRPDTQSRQILMHRHFGGSVLDRGVPGGAYDSGKCSHRLRRKRAPGIDPTRDRAGVLGVSSMESWIRRLLHSVVASSSCEKWMCRRTGSWFVAAGSPASSTSTSRSKNGVITTLVTTSDSPSRSRSTLARPDSVQQVH